MDVGTEMLELDCHLTLDSYVVVCHDENLERQTGSDVDIPLVKFQVDMTVIPISVCSVNHILIKHYYYINFSGLATLQREA